MSGDRAVPFEAFDSTHPDHVHEPYPNSGEGVSTDAYVTLGFRCRGCQEWITTTEGGAS